MPTLTANVLSEGQRVELDLGVKTDLLGCRVIGFTGVNVVLSTRAEEMPEELTVGRTAYVVTEVGGQIRALRSEIREIMGGREIVVSVQDEFQLGQRRRYSRAPIALPGRMRVLPDGEDVQTATRDISAGGLRMNRAGLSCAAGDSVQVVLEAAQAGLRIEATAEAVRVTDTDVSLRFTQIEAGSVVLLQQIALAYYR
jgi:PilZ domain